MDDIIVGGTWRDRLEAVGGSRKHVVAWAAVVAILVGTFALARMRTPAPVIAPPSTTQAVASSTPAAARVFVHVAGAVAKPGLYRFPEGLRIADAIEAAGGALPRADLDAINLADMLRDGLKVEVPARGRAVSVTPSSSPGPGVIDLNTADQAALETIPGVGPVTAMAILQHKSEIGAFETVEQLLDVSGIGPATLEALRPYVTV